MNRVVKILMERDGLTKTEAEGYLEEVRECIDIAIKHSDLEYVEEIMMDMLGLEMDYFEDIL